MRAGGRQAAIDNFRLLAATLVIAIHTSPLATYWETGDFWLTRVLARIAVPFFFMVSGYFLARSNWKNTGRFVKKTLLLYGVAVALYLPLNWYSGGYSLGEWAQKLLVDGTFYHLWYFPAAILGVLIVRGLTKLKWPAALCIACVLYLVGLGGDSYYGLVEAVPALRACYEGIFSVCSYTRNGLFFAPLLVLLGAMGVRFSKRTSILGFFLSLAAMSAEGLWLHSAKVQRHDSMYLLLPLCMLFLFSWLCCANGRQNARARRLSLLLYIVHPWCIVLVRGGAKAIHLEQLFIQNSVVHFLAVLLVSLLVANLALALRPISIKPKGRAWRELDLGALEHNVRELQRALPPGCALMGVVKADAYGHGAKAVARFLQKRGVKAFGVACLSEGIALRKAGIRGTILILGYTDPKEAVLLRRWRLTQTILDASYGMALSAQGRKVHVHLALDTGMHRLGIPVENKKTIAQMYRQKSLRIDGIFSHLCLCDSLAPEDMAYTQRQLTGFYEAVHWIRSAGYRPGKVHIQASYGVMNLPEQPCDYARIGIALYGVRSDSSPVERHLDLQPVLSLRARVALVRTILPGEGAGYGHAFRAEKTTRLAVVSIGYADGLPRDLPQRGGEVLIRGERCPMVGRLCMDQMLVDVTHLEGIAAGEVATLIGQEGNQSISAQEVAQKCGTITNELLSRLGHRLATVEKGPNPETF